MSASESLEHKDGTQSALIEAVKLTGDNGYGKGWYNKMSEEIKGEMDYMQVKAYLEQARNINIQIDSKLEQVSALRQLARKQHLP